MMAGPTSGVVDTVAEFGEVFGVAFQLSDDLIDVLSESEQSGKTPGTDLREGVDTLPVLLVRAAGRPGSVLLAGCSRATSAATLRSREALRQLRAHPAMDRGPGARSSAYVDRGQRESPSSPAGRPGPRGVRRPDRLRARAHRLTAPAARPSWSSTEDRGCCCSTSAWPAAPSSSSPRVDAGRLRRPRYGDSSRLADATVLVVSGTLTDVTGAGGARGLRPARRAAARHLASAPAPTPAAPTGTATP